MSSEGPTSEKQPKFDGKGTAIVWNIMNKMGYEHGQGLGAQSQGRTEAIQVKVRKNRLGLDQEGRLQDPLMGELPLGENAWTEEIGLYDDLVFEWTRWTKDQDDRDLQRISLFDIQESLLPLKSPDVIGCPITDMRTQTTYCSEDVLGEMLQYKNCLDNLPRDQLQHARLRSNPYEDIQKGIFMNRAAMKMANMDSLMRGLFSRAASPNEILHFVDVCAGPGGFSEYLAWRHCNYPFDEAKGATAHLPRIQGYGMTLVGECDFKLDNFLAGPVEVFMPFYGPTKTGDITNWGNLEAFANFVSENTSGKGVHVAMGDGGFNVSDSHNLQEVKSKHIYLCQCLCALTVLRPGGCFVTKMFDTFTDFSVDLIWLMSRLFKKISFVKPVTSRPANSERYLVCEGLISTNLGMAGCPKAPKEGLEAKHSHQNPVQVKSTNHKLPGSGKRRLQGERDPPYDSTNAAVTAANKPIDTTSAVGVLIHHLLETSEKLVAFKVDQDNNNMDVLRLLKSTTLAKDTGFKQYITETNERIAKHQCVYLSKLLLFARNAALQDDQQGSIKAACMEKWKVPSIKREPFPWPLWTSNASSVLHSIVNLSSGIQLSRSLPSDLKRPETIRPFLRDDLFRSSFNKNAILTISVGSFSSTSSVSGPIMVFSRGSTFKELNSHQYTKDGGQWHAFPEDIDQVNPRLPACSLVWAFPVYEYYQSQKGKLRRHALVVIDVAFLYGVDLRGLHYRQRMARAREMCEVVNFAQESRAKLIVPDLIPLSDLQSFMASLPIQNCKDQMNPGPMLSTSHGSVCIPKTLLLVTHMAHPWVELTCPRTNRLQYRNNLTAESCTQAPPEAILPFNKTAFSCLPWKSDSHGDFDASKLVASLK